MVDQHAGQDNFSCLAANLHRLLSQLSGLFVIGLLRVANFQLGQQRQRIPSPLSADFCAQYSAC
jgi:heme A synthase